MLMDELVEKLVRSDYVSRRLVDWETLTIDDIAEQKKKIVLSKYVMVKGWQYGVEKINVVPLKKNFAEVDYLITNFPVVAAGGAVYKSVYGLPQTSDIDMFFYGNYSAEKAEEYLRNIMYYFENKYSYVIFERNQNVTNILVGEDPEFKKDIRKYQFIHRVYPTKISIVGGFDLQCSSIYYDGVYGTTPLGAWCIANNVNIFLHTRRSASYEYRLVKYYKEYFCNILLVNTTQSKLQMNYAKVKYSIEKYVNSIYYVPKLHLNVTHVTYGGNGKDLQVSIYRDQSSTQINDILDEEKTDYGAIRTGYHEKNNARYAATNRIDLITWSGPSVHSIIKPRLQYKVNNKVVKNNIKKKDIKTLADAAPLLDYIISYQNKSKRVKNNTLAEYWLQDKFDEICEMAFSYLTNPKQNELRRAFGKPEINADELLYELYEKYTNTIMDKITTGMAEAQMKSNKVNWIVNNPMRQWTSSINNIKTDPQTYFGKDIYTEFAITISEPVETLLRLFTKHKIGPFAHLNRNTLNIIIKHYIFSL